MHSRTLPETAFTSSGPVPEGRESAYAYRKLPDGRDLTMYPMLFTWRICLGDQGSLCYDRHWCYAREDYISAIRVMLDWDGNGDPPGPFIKSDRD
jgi:hypothetical protein